MTTFRFLVPLLFFSLFTSRTHAQRVQYRVHIYLPNYIYFERNVGSFPLADRWDIGAIQLGVSREKNRWSQQLLLNDYGKERQASSITAHHTEYRKAWNLGFAYQGGYNLIKNPKSRFKFHLGAGIRIGTSGTINTIIGHAGAASDYRSIVRITGGSLYGYFDAAYRLTSRWRVHVSPVKNTFYWYQWANIDEYPHGDRQKNTSVIKGFGRDYSFTLRIGTSYWF